MIAEMRSTGVQFVCRENDERSMPLDILNFNSYEKEQMELVDKILYALPSKNILDIGANMGFTSCTWAKKYKDARIYAFEPIQSTFELLKENIELNNIDNVICFNWGLSNKNKLVDFYFYPWCTANTSLQNLQHRDDCLKNRAEVWRLDDIKELSGIPIDFIKCDVEGNELFVIQGGEAFISRWLPVISIEILRKFSKEFSYNANDVVNALTKFGYLLYCVRNGKLEPLKCIEESTEESNFIFLHKEKHKKIYDVLN